MASTAGGQVLSPELLLLISLFPRKDLSRTHPTRSTAVVQNKVMCWPHAARVHTWEDTPGSNNADAYDSDKCSRTMRQGRRCETLTDAESMRDTDTQTAVAEWHGSQAGTSGKERPQNALTHSGGV